MRWEALFDDFEAQLAAAERAEVEAHASELARAEQSALTLADRLRGQGNATVSLVLRGGMRLHGRVVTVADAWCSLEAAPRLVLIPLPAVVSVAGLGRRVRYEPLSVRRTLSIASALRALARDRSTVTCHLDGRRDEEVVVSGTIDAVGRDYVELATVSVDRVRATTVIPFDALVAVAAPV